MGPALLRYFYYGSYDQAGMSSAIIQLAIRGHIQIESDQGAVTLHKTKDIVTTEHVPTEDIVLMRELFRDGNTLELSQLGARRVQKIGRLFKKYVKKKIVGPYMLNHTIYFVAGLALTAFCYYGFIFPYHSAGEQGIDHALMMSGIFLCLALFKVFEHKALFLPVLTLFICFFMSFFYIFVGIYKFNTVVEPLGSLFLFFIGAVHGIFYELLRAPTKRGQELSDEIDGLMDYLGRGSNGEGGKKVEEHSPAHFEDLLPYAYALNLDREWCTLFYPEGEDGFKCCQWYLEKNSPQSRELAAQAPHRLTEALVFTTAEG